MSVFPRMSAGRGRAVAIAQTKPAQTKPAQTKPAQTETWLWSTTLTLGQNESALGYGASAAGSLAGDAFAIGGERVAVQRLLRGPANAK